MIEGEQLRHPATHRMAHDNGIFSVKIIHQPNYVLCEYFGRVVDRRLARLSSAAIVVNDHTVVLRKFLGLVDLPNFTVAGGLTQKDHRAALAMFFLVDFNVVYVHRWHVTSPCSVDA